MNTRQRSIILLLHNAGGGPLTSARIAEKLGVSARTVKTEMASLAAELADNGARLVSRPSVGYRLQVEDADRYNTLLTMLNMQYYRLRLTDENARLLYIARKLVASEKGVRIDALADEMFLSRGALRRPLRAATRFCESFHLTITSAANRGMRMTGEEYAIRIAMTELFELHYHKARIEEHTGEEYARWVGCDYQERQDIRHVFLKILRESPYSMRDSVTQRLAMYLVIARNRRRAGYRIQLPAAWMQEMRLTPLYALAVKVFAELSRQFADYPADDTAECCFLAIYMLANLDVDLQRDASLAAPHLWGQTQRAARTMLRTLQERTGLDLTADPDARARLEQMVLPMLAGHRYGIDGRQYFDYSYENIYLTLPLCLYFAHTLAQTLQDGTGCRCSATDLAQLSCFVLAQLYRAPYPIRKLKLLITNAIGTEFARPVAERLQRRYPDLIENVQPMELYEYRGLPPDACDAVLVGHSNKRRHLLAGYNYKTPGAISLLTAQGRDFAYIYNEILINAYQVQQYLPAADEIQVLHGVRYTDPEQMLQYLCARHARDDTAAEVLFGRLVQRADTVSLPQNGCAVVVAERALCKGPVLALYQLQKKGMWNGQRVQWVLFLAPRVQSLPQMRAWSAMLEQLLHEGANFQKLAQEPLPALQDLLRASLQAF